MANRRPVGKTLKAAKSMSRNQLLHGCPDPPKVYKNTSAISIMKKIYKIFDEEEGQNIIASNLVKTLENYEENTPWGK